MPLDYRKELTPVFYNVSGLKIQKGYHGNPKGLCFKMHWHERMELILVTSGCLKIHIGNNETVLFAGQLAIIAPEQLHYGIAGTDGVTFHTIMFDVNHFTSSLPAVKRLLLPLSEKRSNFVPWTDQPEIITLFQFILTLRSSDDSCDSLIAVGKVYELIALLYRFCLAGEETNTAPDDRFRDVLEYINNHFSENISSATLSDRFGYSQGYFCRHFKEITGLSPMIYIRILRLEKAGKMLREQKLSCSEIAIQCGFSDVSYFTKCFKSHFHLTPTEYTKRQKES